MIKNINDLLGANGRALIEPVQFGKYKGQPIYNIPVSYWSHICGRSGVDYNIILKKIEIAKEEKRKSDNRPIRPPAAFERVRSWLFNHQKEFIRRFATSAYAALFADIGTGKTFAYLEMVRLRWQDGDKILVICPKSVFTSWQNAINVFFKHKARHIVITGPNKEKITRLTFDKHFYITNPETLRQSNVMEALKQKGFTWICADEAHKYLANTKTATYKAAIELSANIELRHILTGTPRRNKDENLYGLITFLDRGERFGPSFYKFRQKFFTSDYLGFKYNLDENKRDKFKSMIASCSLRVKKRDVLDLPPIIEDVRYIELTGESKKQYLAMKKDSMIEIAQYCKLQGANKRVSVEASVTIAKITKLRQLCSGFVSNTELKETIDFNKDKLDELENVLDDTSEPIIITVCYQREIDDIASLCKSKGYTYGIISGKVSDKYRDWSKESFANGELEVLILQEEAGGVGIDGLQNNCSLMIEYSRGYSYDTRDQKIGRIERPGQKRSMTIIRFESTADGKPTIDAAITESIVNKKEAFEDLIDNIVRIEHESN